MFYSGRDNQHASIDSRGALRDYGITTLMSRCGDCSDSACSETLFGSLKAERLHAQTFATRRQAKDQVVGRLLWHNRTRLHSTLAYVSPMKFEKTGSPIRLGNS